MSDIVKRIGSIKFACLSPEEIRKMSVMNVITADTYDEFDYPIPDGLMDKRMGVIEPNLRCDTCKQKMDECPGHFGHIELARPITHVGFAKDILMILNSTCEHCGRVMLNESDIEQFKQDKIKLEELGGDVADFRALSKKAAETAAQKVECPHCHQAQLKVRLYKPTTFCKVTNTTGAKKELVDPLHPTSDKTPGWINPKDIRQRLEKIPDSDVEILGYDPMTSRPEWMILTVLPVPPVRVRPTIIQGARKQEDDLTHKLVDIIKINHKLREQRDQGAPLLIIEDLWNLLQLHVTTYFDNQTSGVPTANHRGSSRPLKTLAQRLKGKEGRFRSNLSGKRVNFSARTVISPDPLLSINEVGVPMEVARELTVPMRVNDNNIEALRLLIRGGTRPFVTKYDSKEKKGVITLGDGTTFEFDSDNKVILKELEGCGDISEKNPKYVPGANYVIREDGRRIRLNDGNVENSAEVLREGYLVERQLMRNDVVLFNRQPSLHRMSMMAHRVRVMEGHTFRFNLCDCPPYNADFDGDEMNMHILQSVEARAEAMIIMQVEKNILSPRYGAPIIGAIHDHITGAYFLTHDETMSGGPFFTKQETMNILTKLDDIEIPEPVKVVDGVEYWSGKQLFSIILPKDYNDGFKAAICRGKFCPDYAKCRKEKCENDSYVKIVNGQLVSGTIDVKAIGNSKGRIIDRIARDYGSERAAKFINEVTRLVLGAIMNHGFSTGIDDEDIPEDAVLEIKEVNKEKIEEVDGIVDSYWKETLHILPGRNAWETMEDESQKALSEARERAGLIAEKYLGKSNPAVIMARTGARGSMTNLSQMAGCVGQQNVRGRRIKRGYRGRTLPHFKPWDFGALAKGYVMNSYKSGLTPTEFFFHAMGGREGLVDTAVRTSRSGYMQRRLISALEDLKINQDGSVRNTASNIIQFRYGEDGSDPSKTVQGKVIDYDDLFMQVLGEKEANKIIGQMDDKSSGGEDYGTLEKDLEGFGNDETEEDSLEGPDMGDE